MIQANDNRMNGQAMMVQKNNMFYQRGNVIG